MDITGQRQLRIMEYHMLSISVTTRLLLLTANILKQSILLSASPIARRYPLSYVFSGVFNWSVGLLGNQSVVGYYWTSTAITNATSYSMVITSSSLTPQDSANSGRAAGFALRYISYSTLCPSVSAFVCVLGFLWLVQ